MYRSKIIELSLLRSKGALRALSVSVLDVVSVLLVIALLSGCSTACDRSVEEYRERVNHQVGVFAISSDSVEQVRNRFIFWVECYTDEEIENNIPGQIIAGREGLGTYVLLVNERLSSSDSANCMVLADADSEMKRELILFLRQALLPPPGHPRYRECSSP